MWMSLPQSTQGPAAGQVFWSVRFPWVLSSATAVPELYRQERRLYKRSVERRFPLDNGEKVQVPKIEKKAFRYFSGGSLSLPLFLSSTLSFSLEAITFPRKHPLLYGIDKSLPSVGKITIAPPRAKSTLFGYGNLLTALLPLLMGSRQ